MNGLQVKHILCAFLQFEAKLKTQLFCKCCGWKYGYNNSNVEYVKRVWNLIISMSYSKNLLAVTNSLFVKFITWWFCSFYLVVELIRKRICQEIIYAEEQIKLDITLHFANRSCKCSLTYVAQFIFLFQWQCDIIVNSTQRI